MKKVVSLNEARVHKYIEGLPEDENGYTVMDKSDFEKVKELFFGKQQKNKVSILDELIKGQVNEGDG